jgi:hypothetical protein
MTELGYDELRLRIGVGKESYWVYASGAAGQASSPFRLPFNELEVENFILRATRGRASARRMESQALGDAKRFGGALFQSLFEQENVRDLYVRAVAGARASGRGLRLTIALSDVPELMAIPWEYLYDKTDFLAVSTRTPIVRYLELPYADRALEVTPPLRILGVVSSPFDYQRLDVTRERQRLEAALGGLITSGLVTVEWLERATLSALLQALQRQEFHVLHYIGHGSFDRNLNDGLLVLEDDSGYAKPVNGDRLGMLIRDFKSLRLAVLNACEGALTAGTDLFAGVAASLVQREIPAVIAMQFEISDEAAIEFAQGFYSAIAAGRPVDAAIGAARLAIFAHRSDDIEWGTPVLFMRVPDGKIFEIPRQAVPPVPVPVPPVPHPDPVPVPPVPDPVPVRPVRPVPVPPVPDPPPPPREVSARRTIAAGLVMLATLAAFVIANSGGSSHPNGLTTTDSGFSQVTSTRSTPVAPPKVINGDWSGPNSFGDVIFHVTQVSNSSGSVTLTLNAEDRTKESFDYYSSGIEAVDSNNKQYNPADQFATWKIYPGPRNPGTVEFDGLSGVDSIAVRFGSLVLLSHPGANDTITVTVPIPH